MFLNGYVIEKMEEKKGACYSGEQTADILMQLDNFAGNLPTENISESSNDEEFDHAEVKKMKIMIV